jgi:hypothetical protein
MTIIGCGLALATGSANAATLCDGVQDGAATTAAGAATYSNCTFELAGDDYYFAVEVNAGTLNVVGKLNATDFTPNAGTKFITGASAASAVYGVRDEGPGYTGDCPDVSSSDPGGGVALVAGNYYCVIFDSTSGPKIWIRTMWTGSQFTDTTIAFGATLPVELESFQVE